MKKKLVVLTVVAALMLIGATLAFGGPGRLIYDGRRVRQARLARRRQRASAPGVDHAPAGDRGGREQQHPARSARSTLEHYDGRLVWHRVDVGDHEVKVDAANGRIDGVVPRD